MTQPRPGPAPTLPTTGSAVRPLTEGRVRKGGRNEGESQITERPPAPGAISGPHWKPLTAMSSAEQAEHAHVAGYELTAFVLAADAINGWPRQIGWELHGGAQRLDLVAQGPAASFADAKAQAEAAWRAERTKRQVDPSRAIELAYGLLWSSPVDKRTDAGLACSLARTTLLQLLDSAGQARGIELAITAMAAARPAEKVRRIAFANWLRQQAIAMINPPRRCDSNLVDPDGACAACNAIQGEACLQPRKGSA